jgi:hypothetical protein
MSTIELIIKNPAHLEAHRKEFLFPLDVILEEVRKALACRMPCPGQEEVFVWKTKRPVGTGGLAKIHFWTSGDCWAPRTGRSIPSHLIYGKRPKIRTLCIWGTWKSETVFELHTVYPGKPAPREIHDPQLTGEQMRESVNFWARHAIIVEN